MLYLVSNNILTLIYCPSLLSITVTKQTNKQTTRDQPDNTQHKSLWIGVPDVLPSFALKCHGVGTECRDVINWT